MKVKSYARNRIMEKKNYIVGIDIGSSNIVMIVGSKNAAGEMVIEALVERAS